MVIKEANLARARKEILRWNRNGTRKNQSISTKLRCKFMEAVGNVIITSLQYRCYESLCTQNLDEPILPRYDLNRTQENILSICYK